MKFEHIIDASANSAELLLGMPEEGALEVYAEIARRYLGCTAVIVTIAERFLPLPEGGAARLAGARGSQVCALSIEADGTEATSSVLADPGRMADAMAADALGFGFYAGLPLRLDSGCAVGMLAAVDITPRHLATNELAMLKILANNVAQIIELRLAPQESEPRKAASG